MPESAANASSQAKGKRSRPQSAYIPTTQTAKQQNILAVRNHHPGLTMREIAATVKTSHSYVIETLQRYGLIQKHVEDYKTHRADIWDGISHALLSSLTTADIKKIPGAARIMSAGLAYDKMRIERGLSDSSVKPLVVIQVNTVQYPVDNSSLLTTSVSRNVLPNTQAIDITNNDDSNVR